MLAHADRRLRQAAMIGRDAELARAVQALRSPPSVVMIEGEAGLGKSRLVAELAKDRSMLPRRFLIGRCRPIREPFPLGPVLEAVRQLREALVTTGLSPVVGVLGSWLPELADVLPGPPPALPDRVAERHRVFRALVEVLSASGPTVLVLEDLHWADEQTADFVSYLLGDPPRHLSLVLTYRSEEVRAQVRALPATTPERMERAVIRLRPLDRDRTGELAAALLGVERVTARFAGDLFGRTSGSPFAVEELLLVLPESADRGRLDLAGLAVPAAIRDPVLERLDRFADDVRLLVEAVAVLQTPGTTELLSAVCRTSAPDARRRMVDALASGMLVEQDSGVDFRHQLAAQAVYEQIVRPRREELHARAASALIASGPSALGRTAHHLRRSGQLATWADTAERAADRAVDLGHDEEAVPLYEDLLRHAPLTGERRGRIAVKFARASIESLRAPDVEPLFEAIDAGVSRSAAGELRLLAAIMVDWADSADQQRRLCEEAVPDLAERPSLQAWAMGCLGMPAGREAPVSDHLHWVNRSLAVLPRVDDPDLAMAVQGKAATSLLEMGDPSWPKVEEQFLARTGAGSSRREAFALRCHGLSAALAGHHETAERLLGLAAERAAVCENPRLERTIGQARAVHDLVTGQWDRADAWLAEQPDHDRSDNADLVRGTLALTRGHHDEAERRLGVVAPSLQQGWLWPGALATRGLVQLASARGDAETATYLVRQLRAVMESKQMWAPLARVLPAMVDAELAAERPDSAACLVSLAERELAALDSPLAAPALDLSHGAILEAGGRLGDAARRFEAAADAYDRLHCPYDAAQARERAAACHLADREAGAVGGRLVRAALATYQRLDATWAFDRAASLARAHGVSVPARHRGGRRGYGPELSPREAEVARLAGAGRTNAQIAAELFVSVSTVKKHLAATFRKLDVTSRPELVRRLVSTDNGPLGP